MVLFGNMSDIAAGYGSICEYLMHCGTLRVFLRKPHPPSFAPALAANRLRASSNPCLPLRAKSTSWTSTSWTLASIPAPHEPKTLRFCLISSLSTRRGGVWGCAMGVWLVLVVVIGWWVGRLGVRVWLGVVTALDRVYPTHKQTLGIGRRA